VAKSMGSHYKRRSNETIFPVIKDRLSNKIKLASNFTAIFTANGKTKAYYTTLE